MTQINYECNKEEFLLELIKKEGTPILLERLKEKPEINAYRPSELRRILRNLELKGKIRILRNCRYHERWIVYLPGEEKKAADLDQEERAKNTERLILQGTYSSKKITKEDLSDLLEKAKTEEILTEIDIPNHMRKFVDYLAEHHYSFMKKKIEDMTFYSTNYKNLDDLERLILYLEGKGKWP